MDYPHWFCYLKVGDISLPTAVVTISREQAVCAVQAYSKNRGPLFDGNFILYSSFHSLLRKEGLAREDLLILTTDDRGKCIAFTYCDEPGGQCDVDYYDCGCFI